MSSSHAEPVLLRVPDAANMLAISRTVLYELIARGDIPTVHIGRAVRVPASAVHEYVVRLASEQLG